MLVTNREVVGDAMKMLTERQAMLGVLVIENVETGSYDPDVYLVTDPAPRDNFHLFGVVDPDG